MGTERCIFCGEHTAKAAFCSSCGVPQPPPADAVDPLIGTIVADRYQILALVSQGGMGRVYRAAQRMLERLVAIKIIDPRLMSVHQTAEVTTRFMTEARAASRLNHPNVVSVFDFGRTSAAAHAPLFLAMELLSGPTLAEVINAGARIALPRVVNILRQTLAALGEAHHLGITHRDVKPGNIVLQKNDHVSVIDFGVARISSERGVTERGRLLGTPHYMAPEMITDNAAGPSVDLYAVGIILFEMLTGRVPFDDPSPMTICVKHASAPRPDPRASFPDLPAALSEVCARALAVDVESRYPDAQSLAEAIADAVATPMTARQASIFPPRAPSEKVPPPVAARLIRSDVPALAKAPATASAERAVAPASAPLVGQMPASVDGEAAALVGRDEALEWANGLLKERSAVSAIVFWGKPGTGRSRMLYELSTRARATGAEVVEHLVEWGPHYEIGYTCLRGLVSKLAGLEPDDPRLVAGHASDERRASMGLRELFGTPGTTLAEEPGAMCEAVVAALTWAAKKAASKVARLVIVVDDLELVDGISRACLWRFVQAELVPNVLVLLASDERPPAAAHGGVRERELVGLSREEAATLVNPRRESSPGLKDAAPARRFEPLYVEQYRRWRAERPRDHAPAGLRAIVEARLHELEPAPRRVLQALAVGGPLTTMQITALLERDDGVEDAVRTLETAGFVLVGADTIRVVHGLYARVALDNAPAGVIDRLHTRAAELLAAAPIARERRAFHMLRARPGVESFKLVEQAVRLRTLRGDVLGSIAALSDGYFAARTRSARGEADAHSWRSLGRKLATALQGVGRSDQATGLLVEVLETLGPTDHARAPVLEELASIALARGKPADAERWRQEASFLAEPRRPSLSRAPASMRNLKASPPVAPPVSRRSGDFPATESLSRISRADLRTDARAEADDDGKPKSGGKA